MLKDLPPQGSLVVKAPDCGSGYRGFESHRSPQFLKDEKKHYKG